MTLHIIHSNKVERLFDELSAVIQHQPLSDPFCAETIVCPSQAMARWLNMRFALQQGIAAHFEYPLPSTWVWQLASSVLDNVVQNDLLQTEQMAWKIFYALENLSQNESLTSLKDYLHNDSDATKRWSLAQKISHVFERYLFYRPDLIQQWNDVQNSELNDENWQAILWQKIKQEVDIDRVQLQLQLGRFLHSNKAIQGLPQRVCFFSLSAITPLLLKNIQALAQHIDIYFFVLSPSNQYWSDLVSLKRQAKQRLDKPELNDYFSAGHELLASWGRQGQVFQDMLLYELDDANTHTFEAYEESSQNSILSQLQQSLFNLDDQKVSLKTDDSLRFNRCYSPLRECEVLHDQCLALIEDGLKPEDILVIVPNMTQYASSIEAVFKKSADQKSVKPFIPWNLSDSSIKSENPLIRTFLELLQLPSSRFAVSEILSILECPAILRRFKLTQNDKTLVQEYIKSGQINWGFDADFKQQFDVPKTSANTWQFAQQRFFTAYAVEAENSWQKISPLAGFSSSRGQNIAQFMYFLDSLNEWRKRLNGAHSFLQWQQILNTLMDSLFLPQEEELDSLQTIRDAIDKLVELSKPSREEGSKQQFNINLVHHCLAEYFEQSNLSQRFFSGGISFCGMRPMRSLPFKVIVMLGMNELDFPRPNTAVEFDLMQNQWRPGDLLASDEDRYLFLEAILCARQHLIISYCAKSLKDSAQKQASNLVTELQDYCDTFFSIEQGDDPAKPISELLSTDYAMHSFSASNYSPIGYQSYNQYWCHVANTLQQQDNNKTINNPMQSATEVLDASELSVKNLVNCLKDPLKYFYNSALKIRLFNEGEIEDDEHFDLDALQQWQLKTRLFAQALEHKEITADDISAQGLLPHGAHSHESFDGLSQSVNNRLIQIAPYLESDAENIQIDLDFADDVSLSGQISGYYSDFGLLRLTPSNFGHKGFIEGWISHLALCAMNTMQPEQKSIILFKDKMVSLKTLPKKQAMQFLLQAIELKQRAFKQPLAILNKCSFIYQYTLDEGKKDPLVEATKHWFGNDFMQATKGEKDNDFIHLAFHQYANDPSELLQSEDFINLAAQMYQAAFENAMIRG